MVSMVDQIAKALAARRYIHCGGSEAMTLVPGTPNWHFCRDDARTALEAMQTPSNAMLYAAARAMSPKHRPTQKHVSVKRKHFIRYKAMIGAALADAVQTA